MAELNLLSNQRRLRSAEAKRLEQLHEKLLRQKALERPCPFKISSAHPTCTKPGGVCSIRLYQQEGDGIAPVAGNKGRIRALCPARFHQNGVAFDRVGELLLEDSEPKRIGEVGFLKSTGNLDSAPGEDVGRIDMILVKNEEEDTSAIEWVAVEVQAVYFSGKNMQIEFDHIKRTDGKLSMAREKRRPDYRSSGVKRLMPQLLTKVPTLRRWGKKMAVVVDAPFFQSMGRMDTVSDVSNADIVWFLVDFLDNGDDALFHLAVVEEVYTTLDAATLGLTGGLPVTKSEFEQRIKSKSNLKHIAR
ncbi:NotI family restriction endonuclease [Peteryoungia desertarenae]|nr:NotI family restriction endonuclease [Peteryoungia desertarenae]